MSNRFGGDSRHWQVYAERHERRDDGGGEPAFIRRLRAQHLVDTADPGELSPFHRAAMYRERGDAAGELGVWAAIAMHLDMLGVRLPGEPDEDGGGR